MCKKNPNIVHARSTTADYSALHYAAAGGHKELLLFLNFVRAEKANYIAPDIAEEKYLFNYFLDNIGYLSALSNNPKNCFSPEDPKQPSCPLKPNSSLSHTKAGVILLPRSDSHLASYWCKKYQNMYIINNGGRYSDFSLAWSNKILVRLILGKNSPLNPKYLLVKKEYREHLATVIRHLLPAVKYVVKYSSLTQKEGVIACYAEQLDETLKQHFSPSTFYNASKDKIVIIEEYVSTPILNQGKLYEPAKRIYMSYTPTIPGRINPLCGYNTSPNLAIGEGSTQESSISSDKHLQKLSDNELNNSAPELSKLLEPELKKFQTFDLKKAITSLLQSNNRICILLALDLFDYFQTAFLLDGTIDFYNNYYHHIPYPQAYFIPDEMVQCMNAIITRYHSDQDIQDSINKYVIPKICKSGQLQHTQKNIVTSTSSSGLSITSAATPLSQSSTTKAAPPNEDSKITFSLSQRM